MKSRNTACIAVFAVLALCALGPPAQAQTFGYLKPPPIGIGDPTTGKINPAVGDPFGDQSVTGQGADGTALGNEWPLLIGGVDQFGNRKFIPIGGKAATILASTTDAVAHTVSNAATLSNVPFYYNRCQIELNVTAAAAAAGDTLDVYIDTTIDGTNYINAVHFTQVLGNGGAKSFVATLAPESSSGTSVVATGADASAGAVRPSIMGSSLRVRYVIVDGGAHGQSFTFSVTALFK